MGKERILEILSEIQPPFGMMTILQSKKKKNNNKNNNIKSTYVFWTKVHHDVTGWSCRSRWLWNNACKCVQKATPSSSEPSVVMSLSFEASSRLPVLTHQLVLAPLPKKQCLFSGQVRMGKQFHLSCFSLNGLIKEERKNERVRAVWFLAIRCLEIRSQNVNTAPRLENFTPLFLYSFKSSEIVRSKVRVRQRESVALVMFWSLVLFFVFFFRSFFVQQRGHETHDET